MTKQFRKNSIAYCCAALSLLTASNTFAQSDLPAYDLLLRGGHVLDDKNHIDSVMDVAIKDGKIAKVAAHISPTDALKTIDTKGLYVTPGLIDLHVHATPVPVSATPMPATTAFHPMASPSASASPPL